jgi:hypothetical protein
MTNYSKAIRNRRTSLVRLEKNPPNGMSAERVKQEIVSINKQIDRLYAERDQANK